MSHALASGHEPADAGVRHEQLVVVDRAVEELEGESAGIRRPDQASDSSFRALVGRSGLSGTSGRLELCPSAFERRRIGKLPSGKRQSLARLAGPDHDPERSLVDPHSEAVPLGDHHGSQQFCVLSPALDVGYVDPDVAQTSNVHDRPPRSIP